ncbi:MAG: molecular chaperone DnaK, partial [Nocardioides sp.]|nr:molecular chaperone DnaK [Nocardioides sp.]
VDALKVLLEDAESSAETLTAAVSKRGESSQKMGAAMYAAAEAESAAAGGATGATGEADDDVDDAEIVDETPADGTEEDESK